MDIKCLTETTRSNLKWRIEDPSFTMSDGNLQEYKVQKGEDMRIDLVMQSIYDDIYTYADVDVILYINGIDNPLNIREGMVILYPEMQALNNYRYIDSGNTPVSKSVKQSLGVLNKTTRKDDKRKKFIDADYSLPPVVLKESRPAVVISPGNILIGGL